MIEEPDAGSVSAEEARQIAQRFIDQHLGNDAERPRISIPADPQRDDDIRLVAFIEQAAGAIAERDELKRELAEAYEALLSLRDLMRAAARGDAASLAGTIAAGIDAALQGLPNV